MLYGMRSQLFWDGNKRTSNLIANKIMIENRKRLITMKDENILEFNKLLTKFYDTNQNKKTINFLYQNCIFGID